jgi:hypothetical protein
MNIIKKNSNHERVFHFLQDESVRKFVQYWPGPGAK